MNTVLEHAARVLDHQPTRSMHAGSLHRRTVLETGVTIPYGRFMDALAAVPDHFAVIPPDPVVGQTAEWDPRQRSLYEAAMEAAGMTQPLIVLAERRVEAGNDLSLPHSGTSPAPATAAEVFGDVHDALTHLLHGADPDEPLYAAVSGALEELHAARRLLNT